MNRSRCMSCNCRLALLKAVAQGKIDILVSCAVDMQAVGVDVRTGRSSVMWHCMIRSLKRSNRDPSFRARSSRAPEWSMCEMRESWTAAFSGIDK